MLTILYLLSFNVGVNIPFSIENFSLITKYFLIFSIFVKFLFIFSNSFSKSLSNVCFFSSDGTINATKNGLLSP